MLRLAIPALMIAALLGCGNRSALLQAPFDAVAARKTLNGPNAIKGSALIRQRGGGVVTCAGNPVFLMPVTARAREWAEHVYESTEGGYRAAGGRGVVFDESDAVFAATKTASCDTAGNFKFEAIGDGQFYVFTRITWIAGAGIYQSLQGGSIMKPVTVSGGSTTEIVLSPGSL